MKVTRFIEQYKNKESEHKLLKSVIFMLTLALICESIAVIYIGFSQRTIIVPSYIDRKFYVEGDKASNEYIEMMARYSVELISNYTPETVEERFQEFLRFLSAAHYNMISHQLLGSAAEIKRYAISQYYIPQSIVLQKDTITMIGWIRQFSQDKQILYGRVEYKIKYRINNGRFEITSYEKIEEADNEQKKNEPKKS